MIHPVRSRLPLVAALFLTLASAGPAAATGDTLDQSQTYITASNYFIVGSIPFGTRQQVSGQIFTAGVYGYLTRVQVYLENDASSPVTVGVMASLQTVTDDGRPSGREIGSGTAALCSDTRTERCVPPAGSPGWVEIGIGDAIMTPGTRYALVLRASGGGRLRWYNHVGESAYEGGFVVVNDGSGWLDVPPDDMTFRTYVSTPVLDQSQTQTSQWNNSLGWGATLAQTFTPSVSGILSKVSVYLENDTSYSTDGVVGVGIRTTDPQEFPSVTVIGSGTIPVAAIPPLGQPGWVDVDICCGVVTQGVRYALVLGKAGPGWAQWHGYSEDAYGPGTQWYWASSWGVWENAFQDLAFKTFVMEPLARVTPPPAPTITPCVHRLCPATIGGFTPWDKTDGVMSYFTFSEQPNGRVNGFLNFADSAPDAVSLRGCTTGWGGCQLVVKTFACADQHSMTVAGTYKRWGQTEASTFRLTLSGVWNGPGTFTLTSGGYTYTLSHDRIVHVTCPANAKR